MNALVELLEAVGREIDLMGAVLKIQAQRAYASFRDKNANRSRLERSERLFLLVVTIPAGDFHCVRNQFAE